MHARFDQFFKSVFREALSPAGTAGRPSAVVEAFGFSPIPGMPRGFLQRSPADEVGLVVIRDLPATRETLILRAMGAGAVLQQALREIERLPEGARERVVTTRSLIEFRLKIVQDPTDEEREFLMTTMPYYEQWETEVKDLGRREGRREGRLEGQRATLVDLLSARFGAVSPVITSKVEAAGADELARWARRVLSAPTLDDVFAES